MLRLLARKGLLLSTIITLAAPAWGKPHPSDGGREPHHRPGKSAKAGKQLRNGKAVKPAGHKLRGAKPAKTGKAKQAGKQVRAAQERVALAPTTRVRSREGWLAVARRSGLPVATLKELNPGVKQLKPGLRLLVAAAPAPRPARYRYLETPQLKPGKGMQEEVLAASLGVELETEPAPNRVEALKRHAFSLLGVRYVFGGETLKGLDCSSFVQRVFGKVAVQLPRTAREQFQLGEPVQAGDLQRGDLLFFQTYARFPSHVGIYLGNNRMIHASSRDHQVTISPVDTPYFKARFLGAKRLAKLGAADLRLYEAFAVQDELGEAGIDDALRPAAESEARALQEP